MTLFHSCIDIANGVIRFARTPSRLDGLLIDSRTRRPLTGEEVLAHAIDLANQGFEAIPLGCDNHNGQGRCLGHPDSEVQS